MSERQATLVESHFCAPHTKHFLFRVENCERFDFLPGQFVSLTHDFQGAEVTRSYSIASPPRRDNLIELCLNRSEPSRFAGYLFGLEPGARVRLAGPHGEFVLQPGALRSGSPPHDSLFVATGSGLAPIRSMLHHLLEATRSAPPQAWLLFGVRAEKGILYRDEFERLAAEHPNFHFVPTLSRPGEGWHGATGYVQEHLERLLGSRTGLDAYLCGLKAMVDEVRALLERAGFDPASILYEKYD